MSMAPIPLAGLSLTSSATMQSVVSIRPATEAALYLILAALEKGAVLDCRRDPALFSVLVISTLLNAAYPPFKRICPWEPQQPLIAGR